LVNPSTCTAQRSAAPEHHLVGHPCNATEGTFNTSECVVGGVEPWYYENDDGEVFPVPRLYPHPRKDSKLSKALSILKTVGIVLTFVGISALMLYVVVVNVRARCLISRRVRNPSLALEAQTARVPPSTPEAFVLSETPTENSLSHPNPITA
jgi:hypothetical protein